MSIPAKRGLYAPTTAYFSSIDSMIYRKGEGYELNEISDIAKLKKHVPIWKWALLTTGGRVPSECIHSE